MKWSDKVREWILDSEPTSSIIERRDGELILKATSIEIKVGKEKDGHNLVEVSFCNAEGSLATYDFPPYKLGDTLTLVGINIEIPFIITI